MKLHDIIEVDGGKNFLHTLRVECSDFFKESDDLPLFKSLPSAYTDFHKVKVRFKKKSSKISETFNHAFETELRNLHQRAIFANGIITETIVDTEPFYIFPINGFKYMYNREVMNSTSEYKQSFDKIFEQFEDNSAQQILSDLLTYTYKTNNLVEGIENGVEIILYNIPYYYALKRSIVEYDELLTNI